MLGNLQSDAIPIVENETPGALTQGQLHSNSTSEIVHEKQSLVTGRVNKEELQQPSHGCVTSDKQVQQDDQIMDDSAIIEEKLDEQGVIIPERIVSMENCVQTEETAEFTQRIEKENEEIRSSAAKILEQYDELYHLRHTEAEMVFINHKEVCDKRYMGT
jgi:predicted transcriptional regulator